MATFLPIRDTKVAIDNTPIVDGQFLMTTDLEGGNSLQIDIGESRKLIVPERVDQKIEETGTKINELEGYLDGFELQLAEKANQIDLNSTNANVALKANQTALDTTNANVSNLYTNKADKSEVANVMTPKGNIAYASLPTTGNEVGWYYYCPDGDGTNGAGNYVWNGTSWFFGGTGDEGYNKLNDVILNIEDDVYSLTNKIHTTNKIMTSVKCKKLKSEFVEMYDAKESNLIRYEICANNTNNGIPSPTNIIPLSYFTGNLDVTVRQRNMLTENDLYIFGSDNDYIASSSDYNSKGSIDIIPGKAYCFSVDVSTTNNDGAIMLFDSAGNKISTIAVPFGNTTKKVCKFIAHSNAIKMSYYVKVSDTTLSSIPMVALTFGYKYVDVKTYSSESKTELTIQDAFVGLENISDLIVIEDGETKFVKKVHYQQVPVDKVTKSSFSNRFILSGSALDYLPKINTSENINVASNAFLAKTPSVANDNGVCIATNNNITFGYDSAKTIEDFVDYFTVNPLYIAYELKNPIEIKLSDNLLLLKDGYNLIYTSKSFMQNVTYALNENEYIADNYRQGVNCTIGTNTSGSDLKDKITLAQKYGVNSVSIMVGGNAFQDDSSSVLDAVDDNIVDVLSQAVTWCNTIGVSVNVRCACYSKTNSGGENVCPTDLTAWFNAWYQRIKVYMDIAYPLGVTEVSISNELRYLNNLESAKPYWYKIINDLKNDYPGLKIRVDVNIYGGENLVLEYFDIIGLNCYPCLTRKGINESEQQLKSAFYNDIYTDNNIGFIQSLYDDYPNAEIIISEIGTQADENGLFQTWQNTYTPALYNEEVQEKYYELIMTMVNRLPYISGMYIWSINDERVGSTYSFIGRKASWIVGKYWNGGIVI